ncbi:MAG: hypothetical protein K2N01_03215 [Lachnospiraceae bacterium]|nr:hypothetical protein [Lachnospiraceae bacterium]
MSSTDLNLNTDIIHNRTTTYRSLSDLYGVDLFTDQKMEEKQRYEANLRDETERVRRSVFIDKEKVSDADYDLTGQLFREPLTIAKKQDYTENVWNAESIGIIGSIVICGVFLFLWIRYWKKMRQHTGEKKHGNWKNKNISYGSH